MIELRNPIFARRAPINPLALIELGIGDDTYLGRFLARYAGPLGSENTSFLLLDIESACPAESMLASTRTVRERFAWPRHFVVLTDMVALGVYAYDTARDVVYAADFEGGDVEMIRGQLEPSFESIEAFLNWFLEGEF